MPLKKQQRNERIIDRPSTLTFSSCCRASCTVSTIKHSNHIIRNKPGEGQGPEMAASMSAGSRWVMSPRSWCYASWTAAVSVWHTITAFFGHGGLRIKKHPLALMEQQARKCQRKADEVLKGWRRRWIRSEFHRLWRRVQQWIRRLFRLPPPCVHQYSLKYNWQLNISLAADFRMTMYDSLSLSNIHYDFLWLMKKKIK